MTLNDVINNNKKVRYEELVDFFMVMEVYGHGTEISFDSKPLEEEKDQLSLLREKALKHLNKVTKAICDTKENFNRMVHQNNDQ